MKRLLLFATAPLVLAMLLVSAALSPPGTASAAAPLTGSSVPLTGRVRARFATGGAFHYKVEWGVGLAPTSWTTVKEADATGTVTDLGTFGTLDVQRKTGALAITTTVSPLLNLDGKRFAIEVFKIAKPRLPR